jgi:tetratricopeptide (TPR) repeat protein
MASSSCTSRSAGEAARPALRRAATRIGAVLALVLLASSASAAEPHRIAAPIGEPSRASIEEARARFSTGNRAVEAGRWADALEEFERSYELSGVPAALFNVATTLRALGRHVEARDAFDQLLSSDTLDPEVRDKARALRGEEQTRIAKLELDGVPATGVAIALDGRRVTDDGARPLVLEVDAGHHTLRIERPKYRAFTWKGDIGDGAERAIPVELTLEPTNVAIPPVPTQPKSSGGVLSSPIFWGVVGAVVVGAGAVGTWWGLAGRDQRLEPGSSNVVHL